MLWCFLITFLSVSPAFAQKGSDPQVLEIDLNELCPGEAEVPVCSGNEAVKFDEKVLDLQNFVTKVTGQGEETKRSCGVIRELSHQKAGPLTVKTTDDKGNPWIIRFHFGFTRTNLRPTDVKIESTLIKDKIQGFQFDERTSAEHYDPSTWKEAQDAFRWIDEPSNTFMLSIENKNNAFYLTAFHPKVLKTYYIQDNGYQPSSAYLSYGTPSSFNAIPEGKSAFEIQNTHMLMNYQIGYGRKIILMDKEKAGSLKYIVRVDGGVTVGGARSIYITPDRQWIENRDKLGVQGFNASVGQRLEYQKKKVGVFIEQKYTTSKLDHSFLDGKASYKLDYSTINFGVTVDILTPHPRHNKP